VTLVSLTKEKDIKISFDEIFNQSELSIMNIFMLHKKRNFANIGEKIAETLDYVFRYSPDIAINYLEIKFKIVNEGTNYSEEEFTKNILDKIFTESTISVINDYVESHYNISLDEKTKQTENVNEELQFTDCHAKIILKVSMAMRVVIPLITDYLAEIDLRKSENLFLSIFGGLFTIFGEKDIDVLSKLHKLIYSRIISTEYSDKIIWNYLRNINIDPHSLTRSFFKKIIVNIIPKLEDDRNIISFLHVVLKNLIKFQFTVNFPISYKPLNLNQTDSEGLSEFDKLEINMVRLDEGTIVIKRSSIAESIQFLKKKLGVSLREGELEYYKERILINKIQTNLMFLFYAQYVGAYNNSLNCNFDEYITLCIMMKKWLDKNNFPVLSKYITAVPDKYMERSTINKKRFIQQLIGSKKYERLFNEKYKFIIPNLIDSGTLIKLIATLKTNKFYHIPDFESKDDALCIIDERIEAISDEILSFIEKI
jgi:hypothetical protein